MEGCFSHVSWILFKNLKSQIQSFHRVNKALITLEETLQPIWQTKVTQHLKTGDKPTKIKTLYISRVTTDISRQLLKKPTHVQSETQQYVQVTKQKIIPQQVDNGIMQILQRST